MSHPVNFSICTAYVFGALVLVAASCKTAEKHPSPDPAAVTNTAPNVETFGQKLGDSREVPLVELLRNPSSYAGQNVRVEGHVRRACSAKGCWMELSTAPEPGAPACRVTFKNYGFFVPTDSAGSHAKVEGEVNLKRVTPAHVRHYEGEGATFAAKREDGSADEVRLVATGVELRR